MGPMSEDDDDDPTRIGMREVALKQVAASVFATTSLRAFEHWEETLSAEYQQQWEVGGDVALTTEQKRKQREQRM